MIDIPKKDKLYVLTSGAMILPAAFLFYVVSDLPHVFVITTITFMISFFITSTLKYSDRSIIYSVLFALILAVLFNMVFPMKQERFFSIGKLFMSQITVPLLLYIAALATFYESTPYTLGINAAFAIIIIMLGGDFRQSTALNDTAIFSFLLEDNKFNIFFISVVAIDIIAILYAFDLSRKSLFHKSYKHFDWIKKSVTLLAVLIATGIAILFIILFDTYKNDLKKLERYLSTLRHFRALTDTNILFDKEVDLNRTISGDLRKNREQIMIRVEGKQAPGYLRGRAYQHYNNGKWRVPRSEDKQMKFRINVNKLAINAFFIDKDPGETEEKFEIYPTSQCITDYLFMPPNTVKVEIVADRIGYSQNGNYTPTSWEKDGGYTTFISNTNKEPAFPLPSEIDMRHYLHIPKDVKQTIKELAEDLTKKSIIDPGTQSDLAITSAIINYFANQYSYTLDPEAPKNNQDPAAHFINTSKKGHCELFATSAILLLRYYGIPTRYITGFICNEPHPSNKYYIARMGNAHAWCEAYLRDEKRWILVDPTPASDEDQLSHNWGILEIWTDRLKQATQKLFADVRRGYIARAIIAFLTDVTGVLWDILWHPIRGILALISITFLIWAIKHRKKKYKKHHQQLDKETLKLQKKFRKTIQKTAKKVGIKHNKFETIDEWLDRVKSTNKIKNKQSLDKDKFAKLATIIKKYRELRFKTSDAKKNFK